MPFFCEILRGLSPFLWETMYCTDLLQNLTRFPLCRDFTFQWCPLYLMGFKNGVIAHIKALPASDNVIILFYNLYEVSIFLLRFLKD